MVLVLSHAMLMVKRSTCLPSTPRWVLYDADLHYSWYNRGGFIRKSASINKLIEMDALSRPQFVPSTYHALLNNVQEFLDVRWRGHQKSTNWGVWCTFSLLSVRVGARCMQFSLDECSHLRTYELESCCYAKSRKDGSYERYELLNLSVCSFN